VSYQPEERYWTDYLRIALPVVGLLLMLALFWFWAANLIGDDDDDDPPATITAQATLTPVATAAGGTDPTQTPPVDGTEEATEPATEEATEPPTVEPDDPTEVPTDEPAPPNGDFSVGSTVIVNDDDVNFRPEPTTLSDPHRPLSNGEELEVTGEIVTDENGQQWVPVSDIDGVEGFVAIEFVDPAG
jgi:hypothetical protein